MEDNIKDALTTLAAAEISYNEAKENMRLLNAHFLDLRLQLQDLIDPEPKGEDMF